MVFHKPYSMFLKEFWGGRFNRHKRHVVNDKYGGVKFNLFHYCIMKYLGCIKIVWFKIDISFSLY